jgi:hypothetical protein
MGVGGDIIKSNMVGEIAGYGITAVYHPKAIANILPFGKVEEKFRVEYNPRTNFVVAMGGKVEHVYIKRKDGLFIRDFGVIESEINFPTLR